MEASFLLGNSLAVLLGFIMGFMGSGGAVLGVPVFLYVIGVEDISIATAYVIIIVGTGAISGSINHGIIGDTQFRYSFALLLMSDIRRNDVRNAIVRRALFLLIA